MTTILSFNRTFPLIDFGHGSLRAVDGERHLELFFEREAGGRLARGTKDDLVAKLREFFGTPWGPRRRAVCAIGARGVSLRRLRLPEATSGNLEKMLTLQIERELPLPPSELAWGYREIEAPSTAEGSSGERLLLLAAVRRDLVEDCAEVLDACRLRPVFTPGSIALLALCTDPPPSCAVLDIGRRQSELLGCREGAVDSLRILPFGGDNITATVAAALKVSGDEAEGLKIRWSKGLLEDSSQIAAVERSVESAFGELASLVAEVWSGDRLYLAGKSALAPNASRALGEGLGSLAACEVIEKNPRERCGATLAALRIETAGGNREPALPLRLRTPRAQTSGDAAGLWKWGAVAAILALASLSFRYAEPLVRKPGLERRLAAVTAEPSDGRELDQELAFLEHIEAQRSPYLVVMEALGDAAPNGARFESLSMRRSGQVAFETTLQGSSQAIDLRARLISSGVFSSVVVEEQRPAPNDQNRLLVRIAARCRPAAEIRATAGSLPGTAPAENRNHEN